MRMMTAVEFDRFGGPDVLGIVQVPVPEPRDGEVLVSIEATSVNPVDYKIASGHTPFITADQLPYRPGRDVSGIVTLSRTPEFKAGDLVFGVPGLEHGSYAQYAVMRESQLAMRPTSIDALAAAAVPLAGLTAWQGLFTHGGVMTGQRVLIHGGAGGVGHFAIQFAKAKGAYVVTTVSTDHVDFVRRLGADEVIDYTTRAFETATGSIDMVLDLVGGETQAKSFAVLKRGGIIVSTTTAPSAELAAAHGVRASHFMVTEDGRDLAEIASLIDAGHVAPRILKVFALNDVIAAQTLVREGHSEGKVVISVTH